MYTSHYNRERFLCALSHYNRKRSMYTSHYNRERFLWRRERRWRCRAERGAVQGGRHRHAGAYYQVYQEGAATHVPGI